MFTIYFRKVFKKAKSSRSIIILVSSVNCSTFNKFQRSWSEIGSQSATITHRLHVSGVSVPKKMDAIQNQFQNT